METVVAQDFGDNTWSSAESDFEDIQDKYDDDYSSDEAEAFTSFDDIQ